MDLFALPDSATLYAALVARDASYDGRALVGVTSTGIFCRLTCPARKPKPENCQFYETVDQCMEAGFRPCKRCHPMRRATESDPMIATLIDALEARGDHIWREGDITALGFDPSTVRRAFKRQFGLTFLDMARLDRLRRGFEVLGEGGKVIDAQLEAGFASPSAFRDRVGKLLGTAPARLSATPLLAISWIDTPLGPMIAVADAHRLHLLEFMDRKALPKEMQALSKSARGAIGIGRTAIHDQLARELSEYFAGHRTRFDVPLQYHGAAFATAVWDALREIPLGQSESYGALAARLGRPSATRAVARANGANRIAILIPCHRVIGADGTLTGYGGGLWRKQQLLALERDARHATAAQSRPHGRP